MVVHKNPSSYPTKTCKKPILFCILVESFIFCFWVPALPQILVLYAKFSNLFVFPIIISHLDFENSENLTLSSFGLFMRVGFTFELFFCDPFYSFHTISGSRMF